ncbi:hypothetical protein GCM10027422_48630 [Hymenobacter arcticus]
MGAAAGNKGWPGVTEWGIPESRLKKKKEDENVRQLFSKKPTPMQGVGLIGSTKKVRAKLGAEAISMNQTAGPPDPSMPWLNYLPEIE